MTEPAIRVRELGKRFTLGEQIRYATLRDTLAGAAARLWPSAWFAASAGTIPDEDRFLWALRDVSFEIGRGEIVGIIGGNGAGKSTLLKILSRITEPTTGWGEIRGRVGSLLEVGTGFHSELSGRENLYLNGAILGMRRTEIDARFDEIVAFAEVAKFIDTPVKHYSSGMYLRLAFAVAAHLHPEILLVDEVLAVGDAAFQKKCLGKMEDVATQGRTVLFVSHNMAAVESLCSRVIWLRDGLVVEEGPPRRLISKYLQSAWADVVDRVWDDIAAAPGNDKVRLHRARIRPSRTPVIEPVTVHTPFDIEFEYWNLQPGAALNLSLHIYNDQGIMVFNALPITETEWQGRPFPAGLFRDTCHVPGDLMNDGSHTIELLVVQDDATVIYRHKDILTLHVQDAADVRGAWFGKWSGAVRPMLEWRTQLLETSLPAGGS